MCRFFNFFILLSVHFPISLFQVIGCKKELETLLVRFFASSQPTKSWDLFLIELHMKWQAKCKCRALSGLTLNV